MKINLELVGGFLGAGKSTFINSLIEITAVKGEKIVVLSLEEGNTSIIDKYEGVEYIKLYQVYGENQDAIKLLTGEILKLNPHRVIIELNGTEDLESLYGVIYHKEVDKIYKVKTMYYVINGSTCEKYIKNFGELLLPLIKISNLIILNSTETKKSSKNMELLENINPTAHIIDVNDFGNLAESLMESKLFVNKKIRELQRIIKDYFRKGMK